MTVKLIKSVTKIRDEYFDNNQKLSEESLNDLKKHLEGENISELCGAISLVADARLIQFVSLMAKHLDHKDSCVCEILIARLLGIFKLPQYAEIGLKMAQEDKEKMVRGSALSNLGNVLPLLSDQELKIKIAKYIIEISTNENENIYLRRSAYESIMTAVGLSHEEIISKPRTLRRPEDLDLELLEQFKKIYYFEIKLEKR